MNVTTTDLLDRAAASLAAGDADEALRLAEQVLQDTPEDPAALRVAVEAATESGSEHAVPLAERLAAAAPGAAAQRSLGLALLAEGDAEGAERALRQALEADPDDTAATVALGHLIRRQGDSREATDLLERAAALDPDDAGVVNNLVDLHWMAGRLRKAITWAERLVELSPQDPLALLDLAELSMELNEFDTAAGVFARLRSADTAPGRRIFPLHGMIEANIRAGQLRSALDLALLASEVDREELTTDALAYVVAAVFGDASRPAPGLEPLMEAFAAERARYRTVLTDSGVL